MFSKIKICAALRLSLGLSYGFLSCAESFATEVYDFTENDENLAPRSPKFSSHSRLRTPKRRKLIEINSDASEYSDIAPDVGLLTPCASIMSSPEKRTPHDKRKFSSIEASTSPDRRPTKFSRQSAEMSSNLSGISDADIAPDIDTVISCGPPISPTMKNLLDQNKITPLDQYRMAYLTKGLTDGVPENIEDFFEEKDWTDLLLFGGNTPELRRDLVSLKKNYPQPIIRQSCQILNPLGQVRTIPSPVSRKVLPRTFQKIVRRLFPSILPNAFEEEEREETPEERVKRKALKYEIFFKMQAGQGVSATDLKKDLTKEEAWWDIYIQYFEERKKAYQFDKTTGKICRKEIENMFRKNVAPFYQNVIVEEYILYYNPELVNLKRQDDEWRTNLERMETGLCPIGSDGKEMNFHHLTHHDPGIIVLLSDTLHEAKSGKLHFAKSYYRRPKPVERGNFTNSRKIMINALLLTLLSPNKFE